MKKRNIIYRKTLVSQIANKCNLDESVVDKVISGLENVVIENINNDCNVNINGFVSFRCINLAQRIGINPVDGKKIIIPPRKRVNAVISESFQKKIKQGENNE